MNETGIGERLLVSVIMPTYNEGRMIEGALRSLLKQEAPNFDLEILVVDMAIANLVREAKTHQIPGMIQVGKKKGNQPLDDAIMEHLRHARISPEEAYDKAGDKKKFRPFLKSPPEDWTEE